MKFAMMGLGQQAVYPRNIQQLSSAYSANTGNLLFNFAVLQIARIEGGRLPWGAPPDLVSRRCDALVIPMANHLGNHTNLGISGPPIEKYDVPVVIVGIGLQAPEEEEVCVPQGTQEWLRLVVRKRPCASPNISTRGNMSSSVLASLTPSIDSIPLGCPSLFINPNAQLGKQISSKISLTDHSSPRIAVSAGNPWKPHTLIVERSLLKLVTETNGSYIVQHPETLLELSFGFSPNPNRAEVVRDRLFSDLSTDQMKLWFRHYSRAFISVPQWLMEMRRYDLHLGTRIHGCIAAIQAGIPSVCIYIDQRTRELCDFLKIPSISVSELNTGLDLRNLYGILAEWDPTEFDDNRANLAASTVTFMTSNLIQPTPHLISISKG